MILFLFSFVNTFSVWLSTFSLTGDDLAHFSKVGSVLFLSSFHLPLNLKKWLKSCMQHGICWKIWCLLIDAACPTYVEDSEMGEMSLAWTKDGVFIVMNQGGLCHFGSTVAWGDPTVTGVQQDDSFSMQRDQLPERTICLLISSK